MKHNDKTLQSDNSARLDALLSDFLNKDIVVPPEQQSSSHPTSAPLGDLFAEVGSAGKPPEQATSMQTPASPEGGSGKPNGSMGSRPTNRKPSSIAITVWRIWLPTGSRRKSILCWRPLKRLAAARNSSLGSVAIILVLAAGLLIRQSRRLPEFRAAFRRASRPSFRQVRWTRHPRPRLHPQRPVFLRLHPGPSEAVATNPNTSSHERRPLVAVSVPDSSATASAASATKGVSQSIAQNAAKLQRMPAPTLDRSNLPLGAIQDMPTLQPAQPLAPLPLPPNPVSSAVKKAVPEAIRTTTATPALPITKVQPIYPELAKRMKVTGTVHVAIVVDTTGKVISAKAVDGATSAPRIGGTGRETMAIQTCHDEWRASDWNWNRFDRVQPGPTLNTRF